MRSLNFEEREQIAREALLELKELYPHIFKYDIKFTLNKYDCFDAFYIVTDDETYSITKRVWIELKIRDTIYPDYILEDNKYKSIKKEMKKIGFTDDEVDILYINYTPSGVYIWKINNIDEKYESEDKVMNKCTSISRYDKKSKKIYMLNTSDAKKLNYIIDIDRIYKKMTYTYVEKKKELKGLDAVFKQFEKNNTPE